jgi:hypothetical protein
MGMRLASALALVLGVVTFAGPAFAGNGNGNGNNGNNGKANGNSAVSASAPGNSADAPGQLKQDAAASAQSATTTTTAAPITSSAPVSSQGVKPANDTAHDTHAAASSNKTKLYGNGKTAGQIAIHNGASPSTVLHGPGNSQPHKAAPCSGGHHEVDVHALKSKRHGKSCGSVIDPKKDKPTDPGHPGNPGNPGSPTTSTTSSSQPAGHSSGHPKPKRSSKPISRLPASVLAAVQRPAAATLPFTGFPLWAGVALGIVLLGLGLALSLLAGRETEREIRP